MPQNHLPHATLPQVHSGHAHPPSPPLPNTLGRSQLVNSVLGWPAWQRLLAVLPVLCLLWLAVAWASREV